MEEGSEVRREREWKCISFTSYSYLVGIDSSFNYVSYDFQVVKRPALIYGPLTMEDKVRMVSFTPYRRWRLSFFTHPSCFWISIKVGCDCIPVFLHKVIALYFSSVNS